MRSYKYPTIIFCATNETLGNMGARSGRQYATMPPDISRQL
jgi:hypothetical protein